MLYAAMHEVGDFFVAVWRHWIAVVASGVLAVALIVLPAWNVPTPKSAIQAGILLCILDAAFLAWRDERRRADQLVADLAATKAEIQLVNSEDDAAGGLDVSDGEYWVLLAAEKYILRRETVTLDRHGKTSDALWVGDTPIDYDLSRWLYSTVNDLARRGAITPEGGRIYRMSEEAKQAIKAGRRRDRTKSQPDPLVDARTGHTVTHIAV